MALEDGLNSFAWKEWAYRALKIKRLRVGLLESGNLYSRTGDRTCTFGQVWQTRIPAAAQEHFVLQVSRSSDFVFRAFRRHLLEPPAAPAFVTNKVAKENRTWLDHSKLAAAARTFHSVTPSLASSWSIDFVAQLEQIPTPASTSTATHEHPPSHGE